MAQLPTPGSDDGTWGTILNTYLSVSFNSDGTLADASEFAAKYDKPADGIPATDLSSSTQAALAPNQYISLGGGTLTGNVTLPALGFLMNDGQFNWRVTINNNGTFSAQQLGVGLLIIQGMKTNRYITQGF